MLSRRLIGTLTAIFVWGAINVKVRESVKRDTMSVWPEWCCDKSSPPEIEEVHNYKYFHLNVFNQTSKQIVM